MAKQWEIYRSDIETLYCTQNKPLHEVASYMLKKHGFSASTRSYRTHIRAWGLKRRYKKLSNQRKGSATSTHSSSTNSSNNSVDDGSDSEQSSNEETIPGTNSNPDGELFPSTWNADETLPMLARLRTNSLPDEALLDREQSPTVIDCEQLGKTVFSDFAPLVERMMKGEGSISLTTDWDNDGSPLNRAIKLGFDDLVSLLLSYGADPNERTGCYRRTALHQAVFYNRISTVQTLLDNGADSSAQDGSALTPLHQAVNKLKSSTNVADIVRLLTARDASVNIRDNFSRTPFYNLLCLPSDTGYRFSCTLYIDLVYLFLQRSADITSEDVADLPFKLFLDAIIGYAERSEDDWPHEGSPLCQTLTLFLRNGADPNTPLQNGETFLTYLLKQSPTSEQIQTLVRFLWVRLDAKKRLVQNNGLMQNQRQILDLMASSAFWSQGVGNNNITPSTTKVV